MGQILTFKTKETADVLEMSLKDEESCHVDFGIFSILGFTVARRYFKRLKQQQRHEFIEEVLDTMQIYFEFDRERGYTWLKMALLYGICND